MSLLDSLISESYDGFAVRCPHCFCVLPHQGAPCPFCRDHPGRCLYVISPYSGKSRQVVELLKFYGRKDCASDVADVFLHFIMRLGLKREVALVPIPASRKGRRERGYDQMTLVARHLARRLTRAGMDCRVCHAFRRTDTRQQKLLGRKGRLEGCSLALRSPSVRMVNADIIIIDDICTTGATLLSAIRLFENGLAENGLAESSGLAENGLAENGLFENGLFGGGLLPGCDGSKSQEGSHEGDRHGAKAGLIAMAWLGAVYGQ
ncbi:MAG: ComF family protein [Sphaerochaetaceae bacterium]